MKILHYSLGLAPYRSGGLTKYCEDLMISESELNNEVYLLYPGSYNLFNKIKIKKNKSFKNIKVYEIINPNLVTLLGGVCEPKRIIKAVDANVYKDFLIKLKPDVIHIHTLMGLHREFFEITKALNIKTIFTSHDYFGICPKVNLIDSQGMICDDYKYGQKCVECNLNSYSLNMIYIMQSKVYRNLKESKILKLIRSNIKQKFQRDNSEKIHYNNQKDKNLSIKYDKADDYKRLRNYYIEMLQLVDYIHFNSSIASKEYTKYIKNKNSIILNISHLDITDSRIKKDYKSDDVKLRISYLGPIDKYKGFYLLKDSLDILKNKKIDNWELNIYGDTKDDISLDSKLYKLKGKYSYTDLESIFNDTDLIVIPSLWKETFGFIGLEAISYGVPVLISENVGLKDIIEPNSTGIIFKPNIDNLSCEIEKILKDRSKLNDINKNILDRTFNYTMQEHTISIIDLYKRITKERH